MTASVKLVLVQEAYDDILRRSLSKLSCDLGRLIYLASTRDYNTGSYHHDGLAARFSPEVARKALEIAHRQVFYKVSAYSLQELVEEIEIYFGSSHEEPERVLLTWQKLEPFRIVVPVEVNPVVSRLFLSNIRLALAIFRFRQQPNPSDPSAASLLL
jgi:hypothetical protein